MDFFKNQLLRIQQQLGTLSASQKMLTATLVTIMVMTLVLWTRYSSEAEMEPLLDQSLSVEDIGNIKAHLSAKQVRYTVEGDRILVPADRRSEVLADLAYSKLLPRNTQTAFNNEITKQMGPWVPESQRKELWNKYKEMVLARLIGDLPDVANAAVIIDPTEERRFGPDRRQSTATVTIETKNRGERPSKELINAAADIVAGAQSGLARSRISVIVDGASYPVYERDEESVVGSDFLDKKQSFERSVANKIREQLFDIPGVMVAVTAEVNMQSTERESQTVDTKNFLHKEKEVRERTNESSAPAMVAQEPGAGANISASVATGAGGGGGDATNSTETETETTFELIPSQVREKTRLLAGEPKVLAASVRVPRSHFVNIVKMQDPKTTDPTDAVLQPVIAKHLDGIRSTVKKCTALASDDDVDVQFYYDVMPAAAGAPGSPQVVSTGVASMIGGYTKEIAVGALAVVSLFMVLMMVRKGTPAPVVAIAPPPKPTMQLASGEDLAGEVSEGNPLLDGMELDEDAVKTQQMLDQVTTMVDENPDAAANLVKRWLNRS